MENATLRGAPTKEPVLEQSFQRLVKTLITLHENLDRLKHRLNPVMSPQPPENGEKNPPMPEPQRFSEKLDMIASGVDSDCRLINSILERLEI